MSLMRLFYSIFIYVFNSSIRLFCSISYSGPAASDRSVITGQIVDYLEESILLEA